MALPPEGGLGGPRGRADLLHPAEAKLKLPSEMHVSSWQTKWRQDDGVEVVDVIVRYDLKKLTRMGAFFMMNGTILNTVYTWQQTIGMQLLCWALVGVMEFAGVDSEEIDTDGLDKGIRAMNAVLGFCLGLYVSLSISRWWEIRTALGGVMGAIQDILMMVCIASPDITDKRLLGFKRRISRYATASIALMFQLSGDRKSRELDLRLQYQPLKTKKLLTAEECEELLERMDPTSMVWLWIGMQIRDVERSGLLDLDPIEKAQLNKQVIKARQAVQKIDTLINCPLPMPYVHVLIMLTKVFFFLSVLLSAIQIFIYMKSDITDEVSLFVESLTLFVIPMTYQGLIDLAERVSNPLGMDEVDFPGELYQKSLLDKCNDIIEVAAGPEAVRKLAKQESFYNGVDNDHYEMRL